MDKGWREVTDELEGAAKSLQAEAQSLNEAILKSQDVQLSEELLDVGHRMIEPSHRLKNRPIQSQRTERPSTPFDSGPPASDREELNRDP
jgi:hypothetical protein